MIIDKSLQMSAAQAVTASAASTHVIDLGAAGDAYGNELFVEVLVNTTTDSSGDAALCAFSIQTSVDEGFSSPITLVSTAPIAQASLAAKAIPLKVKLPLGAKRFIRVYYTLSGADFTAGKFDAFLTPDVQVA